MRKTVVRVEANDPRKGMTHEELRQALVGGDWPASEVKVETGFHSQIKAITFAYYHKKAETDVQA